MTTESYLEKMSRTRVVFLDVDGVLTDGSVLLTADGEQLRTMNVKDGYALQYAVKQGLKICIISGGRNDMVKKRLEGLGITDVFIGVQDKMAVYTTFMEQHQLSPEEALYMGDDIPDILVMSRVGLASCPADAVSEVKEVCGYISPFSGGKGAVRDVLEKVLKVQQKWFSLEKDFENYTW